MSKKYERGFRHGYKTALLATNALISKNEGYRPLGMCQADKTDDVRYSCPVCYHEVSKDRNVFCHQCGQRIDWTGK